MAKPLPTAAGKRRRSNSSSSSSGSHEEHAKLPISAATTGEQGLTPSSAEVARSLAPREDASVSGTRRGTRARITFRSASPNSINIASALSLLAGVRGSPIVMEKVGGVINVERVGHQLGKSVGQLARKDSIDDSTTSSDTSTSATPMVRVYGAGNEKAPWLEIVGVAVTK